MYGEVQGTGFETIDLRFDACLTGHGRVERLWSGARWLEGPVWFAAGRYLLISDIPNNRLLRWDDTDDSMSVFRTPSNYCNGNTIDQQGRLITCEHLTRRVTRTEHDGSIRVLADEFNGKRLNSPNDVVVKSDGSVWFTDPTYGILSDYEGRRAPAERDGVRAFRCSASLRSTRKRACSIRALEQSPMRKRTIVQAHPAINHSGSSAAPWKRRSQRFLAPAIILVCSQQRRRCAASN